MSSIKKYYILLLLSALVGVTTIVLVLLWKYWRCRKTPINCCSIIKSSIDKEKEERNKKTNCTFAKLSKQPSAEMMTQTTVAIGADRMTFQSPP